MCTVIFVYLLQPYSFLFLNLPLKEHIRSKLTLYIYFLIIKPIQITGSVTQTKNYKTTIITLITVGCVFPWLHFSTYSITYSHIVFIIYSSTLLYEYPISLWIHSSDYITNKPICNTLKTFGLRCLKDCSITFNQQMAPKTYKFQLIGLCHRL